MEVFSSLGEAKVLLERWSRYYNTERPHSSLAYQTPREYQTTWAYASRGRCPQTPGVYRLRGHRMGRNDKRKGRAICPAHLYGHPPRRSGRSPAWPYPPAGQQLVYHEQENNPYPRNPRLPTGPQNGGRSHPGQTGWRCRHRESFTCLYAELSPHDRMRFAVRFLVSESIISQSGGGSHNEQSELVEQRVPPGCSGGFGRRGVGRAGNGARAVTGSIGGDHPRYGNGGRGGILTGRGTYCCGR